VAAAKTSFAGWSACPLRERGKLLIALADAFAARQNEFARLLTEEQGKPLPHAAVEISHSIDVIRYFSSLDLPLKVIKEDEKQKIFRQNTPLGVVAAITPWNFPVVLLLIKDLRPAHSGQHRRFRRRDWQTLQAAEGGSRV
jgi:acyl-CoA reductase-like NAD-dependent aldehyde dehydrogenase